jgi:hypothetical protein
MFYTIFINQLKKLIIISFSMFHQLQNVKTG